MFRRIVAECSPLIPNLVRNYFTTLSVLNNFSKTKESPMKKVAARFKKNLDAQPEPGKFAVSPAVEGRIVCLNGVDA